MTSSEFQTNVKSSEHSPSDPSRPADTDERQEAAMLHDEGELRPESEEDSPLAGAAAELDAAAGDSADIDFAEIESDDRPAASAGSDETSDASPAEIATASASETSAESAPAQAPRDEMLRDLLQAVDALQKAFDLKILRDTKLDRVIDRLHTELESYKQDMIQKIMRPLVNDMILLYDDVGKLTDANRKKVGEPDLAKRLLSILDGVQDDIEDILLKYGVEAYEVDAEAFDARQQKTLKSEKTSDESRHLTIAERLRKGFKWDGCIVRPELVMTYRFDSSQPVFSEAQVEAPSPEATAPDQRQIPGETANAVEAAAKSGSASSESASTESECKNQMPGAGNSPV